MEKYRYILSLRKNISDKRPITTNGPVLFRASVQKGEKVLLAEHIKEFWNLPDWALKQGIWTVEEVIHTVAGKQVAKYVEADWLVLVPSEPRWPDVLGFSKE